VAKPSPSQSGNPLLTSLGSAIRGRRQQLGLSQEGLALESGLDRSYVGGIERGEHNLAIVNLHRIAKALNLQVSELLRNAKL